MFMPPTRKTKPLFNEQELVREFNKQSMQWLIIAAFWATIIGITFGSFIFDIWQELN